MPASSSRLHGRSGESRGIRGGLQYIDSKGKEVRSVPGGAHRVSELATDLRKVRR